MTIRISTERTRRTASLGATTGLAVAAVLHATWATGSSWPAADQDELADLVVGRRPFPSPALTWTVVGLLASGAGLTAAASTTAGDRAWVRLGNRGVGAVLLARGVGGLVVSGARVADSTAVFRRNDVRLYSPLCLALGAAALGAAHRRQG